MCMMRMEKELEAKGTLPVEDWRSTVVGILNCCFINMRRQVTDENQDERRTGEDFTFDVKRGCSNMMTVNKSGGVDPV